MAIPVRVNMIRTRHELAQIIRQVAREIGNKREQNRKWENLYYIETKVEPKIVEQILLSFNQQTLKTTLFYQPVIISQRKRNHNVTTFVYMMPTVPEKKDETPEPIALSSPAIQKLKIKRKKRRSTMYSRIEELLFRGGDIFLLPDPSEESITDEEVTEKIYKIQRKGIEDLPEDILQKIFFFFTLRERCICLSRVCKTWNYILKNPIFWKCLEFKGASVSTSVILRLINTSPLLSSLTLIQVPEAGVVLQELCRNKPDLKELALRYCSMNSIDCIHVLLQISSSFSHLEVLDLEGTEFQSERFFMEVCLLSDLKSLNLGASRFLQPRDLMTISINCRKLETLKILKIPSNVESIHKMTDANFSFLINNLQNSLTHLEYDMQQLGNLAYRAILQCEKLQTLCLTNCLFLTGKIFKKFSQLEQLKNLTLTRAICLTSEDFKDLLSEGKLQKIKQFNISGCWKLDGEGLEAIANGLPRLTELSLENCKSISGYDIHRVSLCKNLSSLNIAHSSVQSDELPLIVTGARRLRSLMIDQSMYRTETIMDITAISPELNTKVSD